MPVDVARPALLVPQLAFFLCRTVEPAARGATALLGERPDVPTLVALGLGPGIAAALLTVDQSAGRHGSPQIGRASCRERVYAVV